MKSIAELEAIRAKALPTVNGRRESADSIRIAVGMATCGIAAGARSVVTAFMDEVAKTEMLNVVIAQIGCIGKCDCEPIVEVTFPGKEKVTYAKVTPEMVTRIVADHIVNGQPVVEYTLK